MHRASLELRNSCPICRCRLPSDFEHAEPAGELATPTPAPAQEQDPLPAAPADMQLPDWAAVSGAEEEETIVLPSAGMECEPEELHWAASASWRGSSWG
uniref:Uncharacterized protein n=1 Tax=Zea mays TaxID=4577 RepID=A0A804PQY8_MAIZE